MNNQRILPVPDEGLKLIQLINKLPCQWLRNYREDLE
jgi:hypothetical protein